eukprot:COSAG05_NODE_1319_length_5194_cov_20.004534_6_plen_66_part_00
MTLVLLVSQSDVNMIFMKRGSRERTLYDSAQNMTRRTWLKYKEWKKACDFGKTKSRIKAFISTGE